MADTESAPRTEAGLWLHEHMEHSCVADPLDVERIAEAMTHVRGVHNSADQYGEGPPCAWCRLAAEQAIEAIRLSEGTDR